MKKILLSVAVCAVMSTIFLASSVFAASTPANPGFGDPVTDETGRIKLADDRAKCKPGMDGCDGVYYKCYQGAKRATYLVNSSECGVEDSDYVLDKDGNKVPVTDSKGDLVLDEDGNVVYQRKTFMYYMNIVINVVLGVIGVVSVAMIIIGGIQYTTSAGDATKAQKAQKTIIFSVIGLVISLLAFAVVNFVLTNVFR